MKILRNTLRKQWSLLTTFPVNFVHQDPVLDITSPVQIFSLCSEQSLEKTLPLEHNEHRTVSVFCQGEDLNYVLSFDLNGQQQCLFLLAADKTRKIYLLFSCAPSVASTTSMGDAMQNIFCQLQWGLHVCSCESWLIFFLLKCYFLTGYPQQKLHGGKLPVLAFLWKMFLLVLKLSRNLDQSELSKM